jgi:ureidoacrylate peracid hydrolase
MHPFSLSQTVLDRIVERRGRLHPFEQVEPRKTALVVIDMQNGFCAPGAAGEVALAKEIVPNINALARATRAAGGLVAWVQTCVSRRDDWPILLNMMLQPETADRYVRDLHPDGEGYKLWPALEPGEDDLYVTKTRFSAFLPSACPLPQVLRERGIDTVLVVCTLTNVCCESSARDAAMADFKTIMVSDANACRSDAEHIASLSTFLQVFGDVRSTGEAISLMRQPSDAGRSHVDVR